MLGVPGDAGGCRGVPVGAKGCRGVPAALPAEVLCGGGAGGRAGGSTEEGDGISRLLALYLQPNPCSVFPSEPLAGSRGHELAHGECW